MKVEPRNPLRPGMQLELFTRDRTIPFTVEELFDVKGRPIEQIHGGLHYCYIPYPEAPPEFALLRERTADDFNPREVELSREAESCGDSCGCGS